MSPRRQRFVDEYTACGNAAEAARRAGYSEKCAKAVGSRLLTYVDVRQALQMSQRQAAEKLELDKERVLQGLLEAVETARLQGDAGAMIRGWSEIGRMCGFYQPERAVKIDVNIAHKRQIQHLETLSDQELLKMVEEATPQIT